MKSLLLLVFLCSSSWAAVIECDICIYGGTSGGVVSAVQTARLGKSVVLIEPGRHLGGMMAGGLRWSAVGSAYEGDLVARTGVSHTLGREAKITQTEGAAVK